MTGFKVLLDASVLYPVYLRDLLLHLAEKRFYEVRWTDQILQEVSRNIKQRQPEDVHDKVDRMIARLNEAFEEARVIGYEDLIPVMQNHPKDRHVLAAAVTDNVDMIVTLNTKDFPGKPAISTRSKSWILTSSYSANGLSATPACSVRCWKNLWILTLGPLSRSPVLRPNPGAR